MKTLNLTLIPVVVICFACPVMGYNHLTHVDTKPQKAAKLTNNVQSARKSSHLTHVDSKQKAAKPISKEQLERILNKETSTPRAQQQRQAASVVYPCECMQNITEEDIATAEVKLQKIRDTKDSNASFETYPQLLQDLCHCTSCPWPRVAPQEIKVGLGAQTSQPVQATTLNEVQQQYLRDMQEEGPGAGLPQIEQNLTQMPK